MEKVFSRHRRIDDKRQVGVFEILGDSVAIEGITRTGDTAYRGDRIVLSPDAAVAVMELLKEWDDNIKRRRGWHDESR